jgi:hypothetical protein
MKNLATKLFLTFAAVCMLGNSLHAQSYKISANIPFAFHAGKTSLPAGQYVAQKPFESQVQSLVSPNGGKVAVASMNNMSDTKDQPRLVFHRYGNEYFLSEIWNGKGTGVRLQPTKEERAAKETVAANRAGDVTVVMASLR